VTTFPRYEPHGVVGQPVGDAGLVITVHNVVGRQDSIGIFTPSTGNVYLVIDISIQNVLNKDLQYSQLYMKLKDSENREYGISLAGSGLTGNLPGGGTLRPGEVVRGYVVFEIPREARESVFKYEDLFSDIRIDISLGTCHEITK